MSFRTDPEIEAILEGIPIMERSKFMKDAIKEKAGILPEQNEATPIPSPKTQLQPPKEKESTGKQSSGGSEESGTDYNPTEATPTSEDKPQLDTLDQLLRSS